jgi:hypothetical protein
MSGAYMFKTPYARATLEIEMPAPLPNKAVEGALEVAALGPRLFLTTFRGHVTKEMSLAALERFERIVEPMNDPVWLSDAMEITGFEPSSLTLGARWFTTFKRRGGTHCLIASEWERSIMAARAMALGLGIHIRAFSSIELATSAAHTLLDLRAI